MFGQSWGDNSARPQTTCFRLGTYTSAAIGNHVPGHIRMRRILATSALPYINGDIHNGHLLEHIQTDVWVRFQRLIGNQCIYVCAGDTHGTATMLQAEQEGVTPEALCDRVIREHERDLRQFSISYDNYYSTHSPENQYYSTLIYERLRDGGYIVTRDVEQLYDAEKEIFLADRYVRGTCPRCGALDQPGRQLRRVRRNVRRD